MNIDHVTIAGRELAVMERTFTDLGLKPDYGGPHSGGITHMALLGFEDGTYIELISTLQPGQHSPSWGRAIAANAGPCAWAAAVNDIKVESTRLAAAGIPISGPHAMNRKRPDGRLVEWELTYLGAHEAGATLPFLIEDHTPRNWRVMPTAGLREKGLVGVAAVVLAVHRLQDGINLFQRAYGWPEPLVQEDIVLGARLAHFADTPVILAAPSGTGWLQSRTEQFGETPCAFLLKTPDLVAATTTFGLAQDAVWFGRRLAWFKAEKIGGTHLACVE